MQGHFLNVDMEIRSREDLAALAAEFETKACVLYFGQETGGSLLTVERGDESSGKGLEVTVGDLCDLVEGLSPVSRGLWDSATSRIMDAGFNATSERISAWFSLPPELLSRIVALNARLAFTIYDPDASFDSVPPASETN